MMYDNLYSIASGGLALEKLRVDIAANNIANQHTLKTKDGPLFQAMQVTARARPFTEFLENGVAEPVVSIESQQLPPNKVYQPAHPMADKQGFVTYPGISTIEEMTTVMRASRAYEANIKIINTAHSLYLQSLSIGEER